MLVAAELCARHRCLCNKPVHEHTSRLSRSTESLETPDWVGSAQVVALTNTLTDSCRCSSTVPLLLAACEGFKHTFTTIAEAARLLGLEAFSRLPAPNGAGARFGGAGPVVGRLRVGRGANNIRAPAATEHTSFKQFQKWRT